MIYLDNAATTWPKPDKTIDAMIDCIKNKGGNPGRGGHQLSLAAGRLVLDTRREIAQLFNIDDISRIVFTGNATESLNLALKGLLKPGDHVITTSMEHNAVARPLETLKKNNIQVTKIKCSPKGCLEPDDIIKNIKQNTKAIAIIHASNVTGTIMPVEEIGKIAEEYNLIFILDAAQTAGFLDIDVKELNVGLLAFTGHKSLYGPQGVGGLFIRQGIELNPLLEGGTGSYSESLDQPLDLPDRYESGTPNAPGITGLGAGVKYIKSYTLEKIRQHEYKLLDSFLNGLEQIRGIEIYGPKNVKQQVPVVSINIKGQESPEIAFILDKVYGIMCRSGLHCAPNAHKTINTIKTGTVRFSMSIFNTQDEINKTLTALEEIARDLT